MSGFHGAFATDVASQQGTLTLPDTWFRPPLFGTCLCSSNLPCLYSTFRLEYPLVLSRFCFVNDKPQKHCSFCGTFLKQYSPLARFLPVWHKVHCSYLSDLRRLGRHCTPLEIMLNTRNLNTVTGLVGQSV